MVEPNPSRPFPNHYGSAVTMPEPALVPINLPLPPPPSPQNVGPAQQLNQSNSLPAVSSTEPSFIPPPSQPIPYQIPANLNRHLSQTDHCISMTNAGPSPAVPQQNPGLLISSLGEQFLSHIIRQSLSTPPVSVPTEQVKPPDTAPVLGSFNFRVEPIHLLHVNSSPAPLQNPTGSTYHQPNQTEPPSVKPKPLPTPPLPPPPSSPKAQPPELIVQPNGPNPLQPAPKNSLNTPNKHTTVFNNAGNLANLLPTGTVLAFQALIPSLSNNGKCNLINKYLIAATIAVIAVICLLSSFTDSLLHEDKVYFGVATPRGLYVLNYDNPVEEEPKIARALEELRIKLVDFVHALGSLVVFLVFSFSAMGVQSCYFPEAESSESEQYTFVTFLPLMAGVLSSFLFAVFPTKRRGIGYTNNMARTPKA